MRQILMVLVLACSGSAVAEDICDTPVQELLTESEELTKELKATGCKYSYGKSPKKVTRVAHKLRERYVCARHDRDQEAAKKLAESSQNLLFVFGDICSR